MIREEGHSSVAVITLSIVLFFVVIAFVFSLFKNIQYPLLWNDESETAMYAKRILQYGYPKIHDGKNVVWLNELNDKVIGVDKKRDICTALVWGQYYFASIGEFFAEKASDIYIKTALLRIPFAVAGLTGLFIMALSIINLFGKDAIRKLAFLVTFFSFALTSTALTLHLREVRHPALVVFLSASILYIYFRYRFYDSIRFVLYFIGLTFLLFSLYHVFHVICFIFFIVIGAYEFSALLREKNAKLFLRNIAPIIAAFVLTMPFFILSQVLDVGRAFRVEFQMPPWDTQFVSILRFFQKYELLYVILTVKIAFFCSLRYLSKLRLDIDSATIQKMRVSNFLSFFFIAYASVMAFFPSFIIYQRYYIVLIPVIAMILCLDIFSTFELLSKIPYKPMQNRIKWLCAIIFLSVLSLNVYDRIDHMQGHVYELFHQYKGPLDFAVPFIKSHYDNTENLIIATNYEELVYMYYLGAKTIIGFMGNNVNEETNMRPDIIIFRKTRNLAYLSVFNHFLHTGRYQKVSFPVLDYFVNNIPQLQQHLYLTPITNHKNKSLDIYLRST